MYVFDGTFYHDSYAIMARTCCVACVVSVKFDGFKRCACVVEKDDVPQKFCRAVYIEPDRSCV